MAATNPVAEFARPSWQSLLLLAAVAFTGCSTNSQPAGESITQSPVQPSMRALLDRAACEALVHGYAVHRDRLAADAYSNLFTEDAQLHVLGQTYVGRAALKQRLLDTPKSPISQHLMHSVLISLEGPDAATGVSYVTVYTAPAANTAPAPVTGFAAIGQYVDRFTRTEQGWKIAERRFIPQMQYKQPTAGER